MGLTEMNRLRVPGIGSGLGDIAGACDAAESKLSKGEFRRSLRRINSLTRSWFYRLLTTEPNFREKSLISNMRTSNLEKFYRESRLWGGIGLGVGVGMHDYTVCYVTGDLRSNFSRSSYSILLAIKSRIFIQRVSQIWSNLSMFWVDSLYTGEYSPAVNFINILRAHFSYESLFKAKLKAEKRLSYEKIVRKMLMKLAPIIKYLALPSSFTDPRSI